MANTTTVVPGFGRMRCHLSCGMTWPANATRYDDVSFDAAGLGGNRLDDVLDGQAGRIPPLDPALPERRQRGDDANIVVPQHFPFKRRRYQSIHVDKSPGSGG